MMAEGPLVILRLPKIRQAVIASPEPMLWFSKKRMELEMLLLESVSRALQCMDANGGVDSSAAILPEICRLDKVITLEVTQRMLVEGCAVNDVTDINKRMYM
ncbi:hypothetical protein DPMN_175074 [Dreissena polymorpha]|uniref:Uncharacterized protein n=1 Tax=Dreissena polymorpha TaxID=45954 RepID=A0A9D4IFP9_DREPO|nr:hypothetical protein DPMN_175074 [Dreissena polymorpha]